MRTNPPGTGHRPPAPETIPTVTETVVQRLEDLVFGELEPGSELPSESDLAGQLGVSRLTVREATKTLQARGLIEVRHGRKPVVSQPNAGPIGDFFMAAVRRDPRQLMDLLEVRRALEVHIAALAAVRAGRAATSAIALALGAMREVADDPLAFHDADVRFHESVAAASGNQMLNFLIEALERPLHASRMQSIRGHLARGATIEGLIDQHARILERIEARDAKGAGAAMRAHLDQTARDLRAAFALRDAPADA